MKTQKTAPSVPYFHNENGKQEKQHWKSLTSSDETLEKNSPKAYVHSETMVSIETKQIFQTQKENKNLHHTGHKVVTGTIHPINQIEN